MPGWPMQWISWHTVAVVVGLLLYVMATQGLHQRRPPTAAIAWVMLIALVPYLGLPLFLLFGSRKLARAARVPAEPVGRGALHDPFRLLARALKLPPPALHGPFHLHRDGRAALDALFSTIDRAERTLHVSTYLIGDDPVGAALLAHVGARIAAGVEVRILVDGFGGLRSWRIVGRLRRAGAKVAWFVPPLHRPLRGRTNLRNHRKVAIADRRWLWTGGRNLAAEYFVGAPSIPAWIDLTYDTDGPLAAALDDVFASDWQFATGEALPAATPAPEPPPALLEVAAQPVPSGPDYAEDTFYSLLLVACYRAERRIDVVTPYFVPDDSLVRALSLAAQRGVVVTLLMPARSNHRLADLARHRPLQQVAAGGLSIRMLPSMMHAKLVAIDDEWLLLGSANIDSRSLFLNYELMVALRDPDALRAGRDWFDATAAAARPWRPQSRGLVADLADGLLLWLAFQL